MKQMLCLLLLTVFGTTGFAQANKADVQKLVELSGEIDELYHMVGEFSKEISENNRAQFKKDMEPLLLKQKNNLIYYYSQNLSQNEVENLIEFYQSPLAKKYMMIKQNYATVLSNRSEAFKAEIQGIIMKYMM